MRPTTASATWTAVGEPVGADALGVQQCARWWQVQSPQLRPVLQERRGDTTLVLASDGAGGELLCTATLVPGQEPIGGMTSVEDTTAALPTPDSAAVVMVETTFSDAAVQNGWQAHGRTAVTGHVGPEVTGLVLATRAGPVQASLAEGRFAAWWPIEDDSDPHPAVVATLSLADGTTRQATLREAG
ncbi:hypothetical protein [Brachybacterium sp. UNK5269]|uniref:hypothetical protein n=1 Tax=Brachybacterium sp. UNK5269 TaxID=3408576 RepID=UPI003BAE5167